MSTILLTGGCGFIGSHIAIELLLKNTKTIVVDDFSNSDPSVLQKIKSIVGDMAFSNLTFYDINISTDIQALDAVFTNHKINAVIHLAGFKAVGESIRDPIKYYDNNLVSTLNLVKAMKSHGCQRLVFSSSATVYGDKKPPYKETMIANGKGITNPYGRSKWIQEMMLKDITLADSKFKVINLRYFNPIGNHPSGLLGEEFLKQPANLFPNILSAIHNKRPFNIFGNTYTENPKDGTAMRDFIHVSDLANAHVKTLDYLFDSRSRSNFEVFNVGLGSPVSVMEIVNTFIKKNKVKMGVAIKDKRFGDLPVSYCNNKKITSKIGWVPKYTYADACEHTWKYYRTYY